MGSENESLLMSSDLVIAVPSDGDVDAIAQLQARVFGPGRFARSAYRVREGASGRSRFCRVGFVGDQIVVSLTFTHVEIGGFGGALLLGPIVVDPGAGKKGLGSDLISAALIGVKEAAVPLVVLVGDEAYYQRFGFSKVPAGQIAFPGPVDAGRILALENRSGALADYRGMVRAVA